MVTAMTWSVLMGEGCLTQPVTIGSGIEPLLALTPAGKGAHHISTLTPPFYSPIFSWLPVGRTHPEAGGCGGGWGVGGGSLLRKFIDISLLGHRAVWGRAESDTGVANGEYTKCHFFKNPY